MYQAKVVKGDNSWYFRIDQTHSKYQTILYGTLNQFTGEIVITKDVHNYMDEPIPHGTPMKRIVYVQNTIDFIAKELNKEYLTYLTTLSEVTQIGVTIQEGQPFDFWWCLCTGRGDNPE